jgi:hypothetical protein
MRRTSAGSRNTPTSTSISPRPGVVAQSDRNLVFDPAGSIALRRLIHRRRAITEAHRCFHRSLQRDRPAIRLDQEKGPPAAVQKVAVSHNSDSGVLGRAAGRWRKRRGDDAIHEAEELGPAAPLGMRPQRASSTLRTFGLGRTSLALGIIQNLNHDSLAKKSGYWRCRRAP